MAPSADNDDVAVYMNTDFRFRTDDPVTMETRPDHALDGFDDIYYNYDQLSLLTYSPGVTALFTIAYLVIFFLALTSNGLVALVIWRNPGMRNVTIYLLANLAVADIAVAVFVMPVTLLSTIFTGKTAARSTSVSTIRRPRTKVF